MLDTVDTPIALLGGGPCHEPSSGDAGVVLMENPDLPLGRVSGTGRLPTVECKVCGFEGGSRDRAQIDRGTLREHDIPAQLPRNEGEHSMQLWVIKVDQRVETLDLSGCVEIDRLTRYLGPATYLVDAPDDVIRELEHRPGVLRVEPISGGTFQANDDHVYEITERGGGYSQTR